jgi:FADH2 O2-dependent halogenase
MKDVIIIGGGPAGAALGSYLSLMGIDNVIFESAVFPRPHVGESPAAFPTDRYPGVRPWFDGCCC